MSTGDKHGGRSNFSLASTLVSIAFAGAGFALFRIAGNLKESPYDEETVLVCSGIELLAILAFGACCTTPVISVMARKDRRHGTTNARTCIIILASLATTPIILFVGPIIRWLFW